MSEVSESRDEVQVYSRLSQREHAELERMARANERSVAAELRVAVRKHLAGEEGWAALERAASE